MLQTLKFKSNNQIMKKQEIAGIGSRFLIIFCS